MASPKTVQRLTVLIEKTLDEVDQSPGDDIDEDTFLPDVLDSMALTSLVATIEEEWSLNIPDDEIVPELFEDVHTLGDFIEAKSVK